MKALAPHAARLFLALSILLAAAALTARGFTALGTSAVLDWDETYYASTTATAAHGLGFYPYVLGYPQIPHMGGVGYVAVLYVLAYKLLGPDLLALRLVAFLVSLAAIAGLAVLARRWYGSGAGLAALGLAPSLLLFQLTNSIRFDVFAIAFVAWALVFYSGVAKEKRSFGWHFLAGAIFAVGLQVHLHTAAAAFAVGLAYLADTVATVRRPTPERRLAAAALAAFVAGYAAGAVLFLAVNVLPNPQGYVRTAALARLSAAEPSTDLNLTARMDVPRLLQTFLSPTTIVRKEIVRYATMFRAMPWWETILWAFALPASLVLRHSPGGLRARVLLAGAVAGGGIVFNSASPLYAAAIFPFFVPPLASFVTHGFGRRASVDRAAVPAAAVLLLAVLSIAILPAALARLAQSAARLHDTLAVPTPDLVRDVRRAATPECVLAGPADLYAQHFMDYPRFVGTRQVEVLIGSTYYDLQNDPVAYWRTKAPDLVFGQPDAGLRLYLEKAQYVAIAEGIWTRPGRLSDGCRIRRRDGRP